MNDARLATLGFRPGRPAGWAQRTAPTPSLVLALIGAVALIWMAIGFAAYHERSSRVERDLRARAIRMAGAPERSLAEEPLPAGDPALAARLQLQLDTLAAAEPRLIAARVYRSTPDFATVASTRGSRSDAAAAAPLAAAIERVANGAGAEVREVEVEGRRALAVVSPLRLGAEAPLVSSITLSAAERDSAMSALLLSLTLAIGSFVLVVMTLAVFVIRFAVLERVPAELAAARRDESPGRSKSRSDAPDARPVHGLVGPSSVQVKP